VRELVNHQEAEVQVHSCDKGGNALGSVWYKVDGKPKLLSETLVELGLAKTVEFSLRQMPYGQELLQAENRARKANLRWWTVPDEEIVEEDSNATASYPRVELSHVNGADAFYFTLCDDPQMAQIEQGCTGANAQSVKDVRRGHLVLAEYDKKFYRAQVTQVTSRDVQLFFIDSGATSKESIAKLRNCPPAIGTDKIKGRAFSAQLAGIKLSPEHANGAGAYLAGYFGTTLKCDVEGTFSGKANAVLSKATGTTSVNEEIVSEGLARLDPRYRGKLQKQLDKEQQKARRNRINMWQYGDNYEDEGDYY
jgi:endonuclease YncB( thermonuclease family)